MNAMRFHITTCQLVSASAAGAFGRVNARIASAS
jgi:hypothetical protein